MKQHDHSGGPFHDHNDRRDAPTFEAVTVLRVEFNRGVGCCEASLVRRVTAYYNVDGEFLFENDPVDLRS